MSAINERKMFLRTKLKCNLIYLSQAQCVCVCYIPVYNKIPIYHLMLKVSNAHAMNMQIDVPAAHFFCDKSKE